MKVDHIEKAQGLIAKGDGFYLKAADEIIAAKKDDPTLSNREIARRLDRSARWVEQLVRARTSAEPVPQGDLKIPWDRGSHGTAAEIKAGAKKLLAEKPEQVATEIAAAMADPAVAEKVLEKMPRAGRTTIERVSQDVSEREVRASTGDMADELRAKANARKATEGADRMVPSYATWSELESKLLKARRAIAEALPFARDIDWSGDFLEFLTDDLAKLRHGVDLVELALTGSTETNWDVELERLLSREDRT